MFVSSLAGGRPAESGRSQEAVATSFAYALEAIPTHHLQEAFKRAIRDKRDDFPFTAAAVRRAYEDMLPDILKQQEAQAQRRLAAPYSEEMSHEEFKRRHNLPVNWRPQDGYPPESDLYGKPPPMLPEQAERVFPAGSELPRDYRWHKRRKAPWELYPDKEHPLVRTVRIRTTEKGDLFTGTIIREVEYKWWVDRCPEMDYAGDCPGYVIEHKGPGGEWLGKRGCPFHVNRWNGL